MKENGLNKINLKQKEFNTLISESKKNNTYEIEQYFSHKVIDALQPITNKNALNKKIEKLIENFELTRHREKTFSVEFGRAEGANPHSMKRFILKKEGIANLDVVDLSRTHPNLIEHEMFWPEINDIYPSNKKLFFDKNLLNNPKANHSAFIAYINRGLGRCNSDIHTSEYSQEEKEYISWLFATHMCKEQIAKGFPVLEGFSSTDQFTDFANLNMLRAGKSIDMKNLLAKNEITKILKTKKH